MEKQSFVGRTVDELNDDFPLELVERTWVKPYNGTLWWRAISEAACQSGKQVVASSTNAAKEAAGPGIQSVMVRVWPEGGFNRIVLV